MQYLCSSTQRDLQRMMIRKYMRTGTLVFPSSPNGNGIGSGGGSATTPAAPTTPCHHFATPLSIDMEGVTNFAVNAGGTKIALARSVPAKESGKPADVYVEVWEGGCLKKDIKCTAKHGTIYDNDHAFGGFRWSTTDDRRLVYAAEKNEAEVAGYFDAAPTTAGVTVGTKAGKKESWGEGFATSYASTIVVLDTDTEQFAFPFAAAMDAGATSYGHPVFTPDGTGIVVAAWPHTHRKLGLKFCLNRVSSILYLPLPGSAGSAGGSGDATSTSVSTATPVVPVLLSCASPVCARSPTFSPDGKSLLWIENAAGGPHASPCRLVKLDWQTHCNAITATVTPTTDTPTTTPASLSLTTVVDVAVGADDLGVHGVRLPAQCFLNNTTLLLTTYMRSTRIPVFVDIAAGTITRANMTGAEEMALGGVVDVLCVGGAYGRVLLSVSAPNCPPYLCYASADLSSSSLYIHALDAPQRCVGMSHTSCIAHHTPHTCCITHIIHRTLLYPPSPSYFRRGI